MKHQKKSHWSVYLSAVALALIGLLLWRGQSPEPAAPGPLMEQLEHISGGARTATQAEKDFFEQLLLEQLPSHTPSEEIDKRLEEYVGQVNAAFLLGQRMELCQRFTLEDFSAQWEQEIQRRETARQEGEVAFGPDHLELDQYFSYQYSSLMTQISNWIISHRDEALMQECRTFYDREQEQFQELVQLSYEIETPEGPKQYQIGPEDVRAMERQDGELLNFLADSEVGEQAVLSDGRVARKLEEIREPLDFEENSAYILQIYLLHSRLAQLLRQIAVGNPVTIP